MRLFEKRRLSFLRKQILSVFKNFCAEINVFLGFLIMFTRLIDLFSVNPHEVKHWMDPEFIPYGWGFFVEGKGIVDLAGEPSL